MSRFVILNVVVLTDLTAEMSSAIARGHAADNARMAFYGNVASSAEQVAAALRAHVLEAVILKYDMANLPNVRAFTSAASKVRRAVDIVVCRASGA